MIDDTLLSHCRNLAFTIAPELKKRPLYLVDLSLFDGLSGISKGNCLAWAHTGDPVDYAFKERIGDAWKGPGPIIAMDGDGVAEVARDDAFQDAVFNVLIHEVAHLLPAPDKYPTHDYGELFDVPAFRTLQELQRVKADSMPDPLPEAQYNPHGAEFLRIATHLLGRSQLAGWQIASLQLFGDSLWFVPQPPFWLLVLMREIVELQGEPFKEILSQPPPESFTTMWEECLNFHVRRETLCKEPTK